MHIGQVTPVYPPYRGGIGTIASTYATSLAEHGHEVTVFTPAYEAQPSGGEGGSVVRLKPWLKWGNAALVPGLVRALRDVDVIHLHYPFYGGALMAMIASILWRKPLVLTYHMKTKASGILGLVFSLHRLLVEPVIFLVARTVLVSSLDYAAASRIRHSQLTEMPFWVDASVFAPGTEPMIRDFFGVSEDAIIFLFVGGLDAAHYFKGVDVLLRAAELLARDVDWHVVIAGAGDRLVDFQRETIARGLGARVHFPGKVSEQGLPKLYRESTVHILPSTDRSEAFGMVTLEAAASGIPSIVSDLPGVRTLVVPGQTGTVVPTNDPHALAEAMRWMLDHPSERRAMGAAARARVLDRYHAPSLLDRLQAVYAGDRVDPL